MPATTLSYQRFPRGRADMVNQAFGLKTMNFSSSNCTDTPLRTPSWTPRQRLVSRVPVLLISALLLQGVAMGQKTTITVSPSAVALAESQTVQFSAALTGSAITSGISWSLSPNVGTISATGLYTSPATI